MMESCVNRPSRAVESGSADRIAPYAWFILLQSFLITALVFGIWFSFGVFFVAMIQDFGWSRGGTSMPFAIGNLVQAALSPLVGFLSDRWGPRRVILIGFVLGVASLAACSQVQTLWHLVVLFGFGFGSSVVFAGPVSNTALLSRWFIRKRGAIIGLAFAGMGVGVKILGPLTQYFILWVGWRQSFLYLAALLGAYGVLAYWGLRNAPWEVGLQPYGTLPPAPSRTRATTVPDTTEWRVRQALRRREFWVLFFVQFLIPLGIFPISVHQVAYLVDVGFSEVFAAAILGHMGLMSACGRVGFGSLSDRLGRFGGVALSVLCSQIGIVVLLLVHDASVTWPLYLYALFFGLGYGARGPIVSAIIADLFPGRHLGTIYGLISIGHGLGGALGPWYGGYIYDRVGAYKPAFVLALFSLVGVIGCFWVATRRLSQRVSRRS
jgi:MFS family permease